MDPPPTIPVSATSEVPNARTSTEILAASLWPVESVTTTHTSFVPAGSEEGAVALNTPEALSVIHEGNDCPASRLQLFVPLKEFVEGRSRLRSCVALAPRMVHKLPEIDCVGKVTARTAGAEVTEPWMLDATTVNEPASDNFTGDKVRAELVPPETATPSLYHW
jgi:hypothetical protein